MTRKNQWNKPLAIALYDPSGQLVLTPTYIKDICVYLDISEPVLWRAIQGNWRIAQHTFIRYDKTKEKPPKTIEVEKILPKFKDKLDGRLKRMYLFYDVDGTIAHNKAFFMHEAMELLNVSKDTILDGIVKNHLCSKHIVRVARSRTTFPKRLSPLGKEFNVFQYDKSGDLIAWYTTMSEASRRLDIPYDTIRNCTIKRVSTDDKYFFTNHIPMTSYKTTKVRFKAKHIRPQLSISHDGKKETMSLTKACKYIGTSYDILKRKLNESSRFIYKGFLIEKV